jgi:hypothetical protein
MVGVEKLKSLSFHPFIIFIRPPSIKVLEERLRKVKGQFAIKFKLKANSFSPFNFKLTFSVDLIQNVLYRNA